MAPTASTSPSSHGMMRKRTLQDAQPRTPGMVYAHSPPTSSSPAARVFQFDSSPRTGGVLSSPASIYSSPMARSTSAQSSFSPFSPFGGSNTSPLSKADADHDPDATVRRPKIKRRRTLADANMPPPPDKARVNSVSPQQQYVPTRGFGKDGEDVWPPDCEEAFHVALRLLPRLGRKKLIIEGKAKGRNELIGDYILRVTGKERSRKQVSSHIQVLKHQLKDDQEFMDVVSEPVEGDDCFEGNNAALFFGTSSPYACDGAFAVPMFNPQIHIDATNFPLLPPHSGPSFALHSPFVMHPAHGVATPTTQLANAFEDMTVLPAPVQPACPFVPAELCMWAAPSELSCRQDEHVFAQLNPGAEPTGKVFVEDLPSGVKRYPMLADMIERQPCQFLHVKLNFDVPRANESAGLADMINTQLRLHSLQDLNLHVVTSFHHDGELGAQLIESLPNAQLLDLYDQGAPSHSHPNSPLHRSFRHKYAYDVPFSPHWWTSYLSADEEFQRHASPTRRTAKASALARSGKARFELADSLSGISILQEYVVNFSENAPLPHPATGNALRGSDLGDVVLVVAFDVELCEGVRKGSAELSYLSTRRSEAPRRASGHANYAAYPSAPIAPPMLRSVTSPASMAFPTAPHGSMPPPMRPLSRLPSSHAVPRQHAPHPNLSLHIPSPTQFVRRGASPGHLSLPTGAPLGSAALDGPHTPWGQIAHTPGAPPPLLHCNAEDDAQQRERLQHIWLQTSSAYDQHSPAFLGMEPCAPSALLEEDAAFAAGLAPPLDLEGMFESCLAPGAYGEDEQLPTASHALNALTASAAALPTPSFATFPPAQLELFSMPPPPLPVPPLTSQATPQTAQSMSVSSSSSGSSTSLRTVADALPGPRSGGDPAKAAPSTTTKASARKMEQDYFSSLFGSTTKYAGVTS